MNPSICYVIAGPNGAGKTTFALRYLREMTGCRNFINADLIAEGLSPLDWIPDAEFSRLRVRQRVESGGHDIPDEAIARRYRQTVSNFLTVFAPLCDEVFCYDNSALGHVLVFADTNGRHKVLDSDRYKWILESCDD